MDAQVPRNISVIRVQLRLPYHSRQPNPGERTQNGTAKTMVRQIFASIHQRQEERRMIMEAVHEKPIETVPIRTKRTRQNYRAAAAKAYALNGQPKMPTVRDVVGMIPTDCNAVVACNPFTKICRFRTKKVQKEEIETVAKPRHRTPGHTLILTYSLDQSKDLEKLLDEAEQ